MLEDLPEKLVDRIEYMQNILIDIATGGALGYSGYAELRAEFISMSSVKQMLPQFVLKCRNESQFWQFIKYEYSTYADRRNFIWDAFRPLLDALESGLHAPSDKIASSAFIRVDATFIHDQWEKALTRRNEDPSGAITTSRALLESVCKHILHQCGKDVNDKDDFGLLYKRTIEELKLAPEHYQDKDFKAILGSCQSIVNTLAGLRNRIGDAHGSHQPVNPLPRHAALAVNLAGTMATFLLDTWEARKTGSTSLK